MPNVTVNLYAGLRQFSDGEPTVEAPIEPGQTVQAVLDHFGIPAEKTRIIFVDHRAATPAEVLNGGETLGLFPAIGGG